MFIDSEKYRAIADRIIKLSNAPIVEVFLTKSIQDNTRFMESTVHQYTKVNELRVDVRVRFDKKSGTATTNDTSEEGLLSLVKQAEESALNSPVDPYLPDPEENSEMIFNNLDSAVFEMVPEFKVNFLEKIFSEFAEDFVFYGTFRSSLNFIGLYNNLGLKAGYFYSALNLSFLIEDREDKDTFWFQHSSPDLDSLKYEIIAGRIRDFRRMKYPDEILAPGKYTVILSPYAVKDIIDFMEYIGFSSRALDEGISFLKDKVGQKVFPDYFTLEDKPLRKTGFFMPFDLDGVKKSNMSIFEKGVFKNFIFDKRMAKKFNTNSTGHALGFPASYPYAGQLELKAGKIPLDELIKESPEVVYISRFHYVNVLDPISFTLTGMTRDGTFRIRRHGKMWSRLPNLRFQVNFLELLNNVTGVSKEREFVGNVDSYDMDFPIGFHLPYLRAEGFNIIGISTEEE